MSAGKKSSEKVTATSSSNKKGLLIKVYENQVSGRSSIFSYDPKTLCKSYVSRELYFYHNMPKVLKSFTAEFKGLINIVYYECIQGIVEAYVQPKSFVPPNSAKVKSLIDNPKPHSKRCVKDYGNTHRIYPSNPALALVQDGRFDDVIKESYDDVDQLARGLDANVNLGVPGRESQPEEKLNNPWGIKVVDDALSKMKSNPIQATPYQEAPFKPHAKSKRFILLENVTSNFTRPCVLDLKMGTRVRENPSLAKLFRHVTAINIGSRLSGMQIYNSAKNDYVYVDKYYGHNLSVDGFKTNLTHFFSRGKSLEKRDASSGDENVSLVDACLIKGAIYRLSGLRDAIAKLDSHRFYSGSLLLIYEGKTQSNDAIKRVEPSFQDMSKKDEKPSPVKRTRPKSLPSSIVKAITTDATNNSLAGDVMNPSMSKKKSPVKRRKRTQSCDSWEQPGHDSSKEISTDTYEDNKHSIEVRLIDFAHFCFNDPTIHPGPDGGFLFGLDSLIALLRAMLVLNKDEL